MAAKIPLLLGVHAEAGDLINPAQQLTEAIVQAAIIIGSLVGQLWFRINET